MTRAAYEDRSFAMYTDLVSAAEAVCGWRAGRLPESLAALDGAATRILDMEAWPWAAFAFSYLGEIGTDSRRPDVTARALAGMEQAAERLDRDLYWGLAALARAGDELAARRPEQAAAAARDALERIPAACRVFTASAWELLGRALLSLDRPSARSPLETAAAQFDACSATFRRDRALQSLRRFGHAGKRAAAALGDATLTARELDVARLAALGHTAPEIAQQLVIGTRTVETHLVRIYAKLGVSSKRELAHRAAEFGLT